MNKQKEIKILEDRIFYNQMSSKMNFELDRELNKKLEELKKMNRIQNEVIEEFVNIKVAQFENFTEREPEALYEALDCQGHSLADAIIEMLANGAYIQPDDTRFSRDSIDEILEYAELVELDITLGFDSVVESFVLNSVDLILNIDLIELM
jgi:hypothetical protein